MSNAKVIAVVGPTASGKSALAVALAQKYNGEVVSADSRQIYRGMDIGTAKPTSAEMAAVPHHLIDVVDPDHDYTVAQYKDDASSVIEKILGRGRLPIIAGGTGLYVRAVLENLDIPRIASDPRLRAEIEKEIAEKGLVPVFERLVALDPEAAYIVDPKNPRRIVRALEVATLTGKPFTAQRVKGVRPYDSLTIGLDVPAKTLHQRIDDRVDQMMKDGLIDEVAGLIKKYGSDQVAFDAIGYREIIAHLNGTMPLEEAVLLIKKNTWQYARRQMTWFRNDKTTKWVTKPGDAAAIVENFLREK